MTPALVVAVALAQMTVLDEGARKGTSSTVNCSGAGVTCTMEAGRWVLTVPGGGAGSVGPYCSSGFVTASDGGSWYCTNGIAKATTATTATALTTNPTDCSANQYATTIDTGGNLTCAQVATSQLSGTITNAQLASTYSGVGACSASRWASTLNGNAAPTCTRPAFTDLSGSPLAGGSSPQVQYNNSGVLGGVSNVTSNGTNELFTGETSIPATTASVSKGFDFYPAAAMPHGQGRIDPAFGVPLGVGSIPIRELAAWSPQQSTITMCHLPESTSAASAAFYNVGTAILLTSTGSNQGAPGGWDAGSAIQRQNYNQRGVGNVKLTWSSMSETSANTPLWTQNGFVAWERWATFARDASLTDAGYSGAAVSLIMGWSGTTGSILGSAPDPSAQTNSFYFGCDSTASPELPTSTPLLVCSNDTSVAATCNNVGAGWNCRGSNGAVEFAYDGWFWAAPNEGTIHWFLTRIDAAGGVLTATGSMSSHLPQPTAKLAWHGGMNAGNDAGAATSFTFGLGGVCEWVGY